MAMTIEQLQAFSNTKPELRAITENIIDYLEALALGGGGGGGTDTLGTVNARGHTTDEDIEITNETKGFVLKIGTSRIRITAIDNGDSTYRLDLNAI